MTKKLHTEYQIRWKRYKAFDDTGWLRVRPITLLIGANNSGKSSILSPLLLLNQTLASKDSDVPLVTRGPLIDVGNYADFVHNNECESSVSFGFRYHVHKSPDNVKPVGKYPPGSFEVTFQQREGVEDLQLIKYQLFDIYKRSYISRRLLASGRYGFNGKIKLKDMTKEEQSAVSRSEPINFLFSPSPTLYEFQLPDRDEESGPVAFSKPFSHYLKVVAFSFNQIMDLFTELSYIGPIREKPRRYYRIAGETPATVGPRGENAANLLRRRYETLEERLNQWVARFEFGESISCKEISSDLFAINFHEGNRKTNIADAGFGASQVLPLIIQALAAPKDSLTVAEQPEIHLNPRLQGELADLFAEMASTGHRVLIETHSEHLLLRLRRLIASGELDAEDVMVYYVERDKQGSRIREVPIQSNGHIEATAWPHGFFGDSLKESLALATAQASRQG